MPSMKFIVEGKEHSEQIQKALFRLGYYWHGGETASSMVEIHEPTAPYLFADSEDKSITYGHGRQHFEYHHYPEYVYRLGMVEPRDGRPVQHVPPPVMEDPHAHVKDEIILDAKAPLGVKPRAVADRLFAIGRANELAEAITRFTNASRHVPVVWVEEYNERIETILKFEKTA